MIYEFGEFQIDKQLFELRRGGQVLSIQRTVLLALVYLIEHRERVVTKEELIAGPWHGVSVSDGSISQAIMLARKILADDGAHQRFIKTVRGIGYRFAADVQSRPSGPATPEAPVEESPRAQPASRRNALCGRGAESSELFSALHSAQAGQGSVVLLAGPPGIGKTSLCEHLTHEAVESGLPVVWGRSWEGGGAPAFWPWSQIFRRLLLDPELDFAAEVSPREVEHLIKLLPDVGDCFPEGQRALVSERPGGPTAQPHLLFDTAATVLQRVAKRHDALVVVLEDLHASDVSSIALLDYLAKTVHQSHLLVIGTYREVELRGAEVVANLVTGLHGVRCTLALGGLTERDVADMLGTQVGSGPSDELIRRIHRATAGNPLFLQEVRRLLEAEQRTGADINKIQFRIPGRIVEAIRRHVRKLGEPTRELVALAAVIGPDFDLALLQAAASAPAHEILERLSPAIEAGLLQESYDAVARYRFSHELIRNTVYSELAPAARAAMHRAIGEAIESSPPSGTAPHSRLAHHFFAASGLCGEKAVTYATKAGDAAMASTAYAEAIEHYQLALQALDLIQGPPRERGKILDRLGLAYRGAGRTDDAMQTFERVVALARSAKLPGMFAKAALGHGFTWRAWAHDEKLIATLQEALDLLEPKDSALRSIVMGRLAASLWFSGPSQRERRKKLSDEAIAMARRLQDPRALSAALICARTANWGVLPLTEQLEISTEVVSVAESSGVRLRDEAQEGRMFRISDLCELGRFVEVDRELARYAKEAEQARHPLELAWVARWRAVRATMAGQLNESLALATQARENGKRAGDRNSTPLFFEQRHIVDAATGAPHEDVTRSAQTVERHPDLVLAQLRLARAYCDAGDLTNADRILAQLTAERFDRMPDNHTRFGALVAGAAVCRHLGPMRAGEAARMLYAILLPDAERILTFATAAVCYGPAHHYLGVLAAVAGMPDQALAHFRFAQARAQLLNAPLWLIEAQLGEAELRASQGAYGVELDTLVRSAASASEQLGLSGLQRRAHALMQAARDAGARGRAGA